MKFLFVLILATFLTISRSELRFRLATIATNCSLLLPVERNTHTIFLDMAYNTDAELKNCIINNIHSEQSALLLNVFNKDINIQVNATRKHIKTTDNPNIILMTKYLTVNMIQSPLLKFMIESHWSLLYVIVTSKTQFKCKDGTMNRKDFLMLENIMNKLWHGFRVMRVGVALPFACKKQMVIYKGKRSSNQMLYDRTIHLINVTNSKDLFGALIKSGNKLADDYPMRVSIFNRYPTSITDCKNLHYYIAPIDLNLTVGFCGMDGLVMYDVLTHFKFNLSFPEEENCNNYGYFIPGHVSGSLGCIVRKELDISFNSRFMTLYSNENIYYLHYVTSDKLCALVKMPDIVPIWHGVFNVYRGPLWFLIVVVVVAIGAIMWATAIINKKLTGEKTMTIWFYLNEAVLTTMFGSSPRKTRTFILLRSTCLFGSIVFVAIYQGHINHVYTTLSRFEKISTLEQLYSSGATLYTSQSIKELTRQLHNPNDKLQKAFFNRSIVMPGDRLGVLLQHTSATTLDRKSDAIMEILMKYSDKDGNPLIDIVDECYYTYYLSYIARSGFPFFEDLQKFIERLTEAGLPSTYYKWTQQMLRLPSSMPESHTVPRPFSKITLYDLCIPFAILFLGQIGSVIIFLVEIWKGRRHRFKLFKRRT